MDAISSIMCALLVLNLGWTITLAIRLGSVEGKVNMLLKSNGIEIIRKK